MTAEASSLSPLHRAPLRQQIIAQPQAWFAAFFSVIAIFAPFTVGVPEGNELLMTTPTGLSLVLFIAALLAIRLPSDWRVDAALCVASFAVAWMLIKILPLLPGRAGTAFWLQFAGSWLLAWLLVARLSVRKPANVWIARAISLAIPVLFGIWLLIFWEILVRGAGVPPVLLPPPTMIGERFAGSLSILAADFVQTFVKAVIPGYIMGCSAGFLVAIAVDRSPFLRRGLLPIGNLVSALPIVGVAPIMVMWFGFDWQSKAAVVVIMTFFPMLVNTVAGLASAGAMERDLMRTYAAGYWTGLMKLRLPAALPFIFNALKINSTLALIGAIVAEFFGTPIVGMGFRISTEVGRMNIDMVWAEIALAALAGSAFYGLISVIERAATFWHQSYR